MTELHAINLGTTLRGGLAYLVYFFIKCVMKKKYDRLIKMDYLANNQLKKDIDMSAEQLSILMPDFVIERLNNFEISSTQC